jgi:hypothetical protein
MAMAMGGLQNGNQLKVFGNFSPMSRLFHADDPNQLIEFMVGNAHPTRKKVCNVGVNRAVIEHLFPFDSLVDYVFLFFWFLYNLKFRFFCLKKVAIIYSNNR